jgi:hypothetical protein
MCNSGVTRTFGWKLSDTESVMRQWIARLLIVVSAGVLGGCASSHELPSPKGAWEPVNCVPAVEGES